MPAMDSDRKGPGAVSKRDDDAMASTSAEMKKEQQVIDVQNVLSPLGEVGPGAKPRPLSDERAADDPGT